MKQYKPLYLPYIYLINFVFDNFFFEMYCRIPPLYFNKQRRTCLYKNIIFFDGDIYVEKVSNRREFELTKELSEVGKARGKFLQPNLKSLYCLQRDAHAHASAPTQCLFTISLRWSKFHHTFFMLRVLRPRNSALPVVSWFYLRKVHLLILPKDVTTTLLDNQKPWAKQKIRKQNSNIYFFNTEHQRQREIIIITTTELAEEILRVRK